MHGDQLGKVQKGSAGDVPQFVCCLIGNRGRAEEERWSVHE
jgi:hypothetical protein